MIILGNYFFVTPGCSGGLFEGLDGRNKYGHDVKKHAGDEAPQIFLIWPDLILLLEVRG